MQLRGVLSLNPSALTEDHQNFASSPWYHPSLYSCCSLCKARHVCSTREGLCEPLDPPDAVEEVFVESQVESFLQQDSTDGAHDLCGNKQSSVLAFKILKRLLLAAQARAEPPETRKATGKDQQQILLLKKQARLHFEEIMLGRGWRTGRGEKEGGGLIRWHVQYLQLLSGAHGHRVCRWV